jgi:hypothetical protein
VIFFNISHLYPFLAVTSRIKADVLVIALIGSHGWVETAINRGNAQLQLQMKLGAKDRRARGFKGIRTEVKARMSRVE